MAGRDEWPVVYSQTPSRPAPEMTAEDLGLGGPDAGARMKYRILRDYGSYEGMKFEGDEFATVDAAVKAALNGYGGSFFIVQVIDWEAIEAIPPSVTP